MITVSMIMGSAVLLAGCMGGGGLPIYASSLDVPPAEDLIADQLRQISVGDSLSELMTVFPDAELADERAGVTAYRIAVDHRYYIGRSNGARGASSNTSNAGVATTLDRRAEHSMRTEVWFYFYDDQYLKYAGRNRWPNDPEAMLRGIARR